MISRANEILILFAWLVASLLCGCASSPLEHQDWPPPTLLTEDLPSYRAPADPDEPARTDELIPSGNIGLRHALAAALLHNPDLVASAWSVRLEEARRLQASLLPNPELSLQLENIGGSGDSAGTDGAETTLLLSQLIELGGDREHRVQVARRAWDVAAWEYESKRLDVVTQTAIRFIDVLELQRRVELSERSLSLARETHAVIERRVQLGDVSPIDETKARLLTESRQIETDRTRRTLEVARRELSAMWGAVDVTFDRVEGDLDRLLPVPALEQMTRLVESNPRVLRWVAEIERRRARTNLAKAEAVPDVVVGAGPRYLSETDDVAAVLGISLPLTIFDRNQGGILESRLAVSQAAAEREAAQARIASDLVRAHARLTTAYHEARAVRERLLPTARTAFESTRRAYEEGKVAYLDVLDAQRTLFDTESQLLAVLAEYHAAMADVEGLIARPLDDANPQTQSPDPTGVNS